MVFLVPVDPRSRDIRCQILKDKKTEPGAPGKGGEAQDGSTVGSQREEGPGLLGAGT